MLFSLIWSYFWSHMKLLYSAWTSFSSAKPQRWFQVQSLLDLLHQTLTCYLETLKKYIDNQPLESVTLLWVSLSHFSCALFINLIKGEKVFQHTLAIRRPTLSWITAQVAQWRSGSRFSDYCISCWLNIIAVHQR